MHMYHLGGLHWGWWILLITGSLSLSLSRASCMCDPSARLSLALWLVMAGSRSGTSACPHSILWSDSSQVCKQSNNPHHALTTSAGPEGEEEKPAAQTSIVFSDNAPVLAVGDSGGSVKIYRMSGVAHKPDITAEEQVERLQAAINQ